MTFLAVNSPRRKSHHCLSKHTSPRHFFFISKSMLLREDYAMCIKHEHKVVK
jgi:hypothetical protein